MMEDAGILEETSVRGHNHGNRGARQTLDLSRAMHRDENQETGAVSDQCDTRAVIEPPLVLAGRGVENANHKGDEPSICEQREDAGPVTDKPGSCADCHDGEQSRDADSVRVGGSGCSSPADSTTAGAERDLRLQVGPAGAWSPGSGGGGGGSQIHYVADSPLTPTRFRSKSEADTSTNPVHAQAVVSTDSVRPKERRTSSSSSAGGAQSPGSAESPRGEPAGSASGSLSLHGTVTREGEMLSFVADDLLEKIRQSGDPLKAKDRGSSTGSSACPTPPSSHSRTPSLSLSGVSASAIPPVDPSALADIERHCKRVADNVELMMGHLSSTLQNMSAITVGHTQTYRDAVDKAGMTVDQSVKCMYALIAKCEELNKTMEPVHKLANQIKSVKRLLDEMEAACK